MKQSYRLEVIITESIIDSISYAKIYKLDPNTTLLCGTNGQVTKAHKEVLEWINNKIKEPLYILMIKAFNTIDK